MNYEFIYGKSILDSDCQALVNPVNCQGVMGKGLALEFKKKYPDNFKDYKLACESGYLRIGKCAFGHFSQQDGRIRIIVNFPTKNEWRKPSKYEYIEKGLIDLVQALKSLPFITSIAIPLLGCGLGGLDETIVSRMILMSLMDGLGNDYKLDVEIYT